MTIELQAKIARATADNFFYIENNTLYMHTGRRDMGEVKDYEAEVVLRCVREDVYEAVLDALRQYKTELLIQFSHDGREDD